jgi:hypothetical protein
MLEYDPNLPQEFTHQSKRPTATAGFIALALAVTFLVAALFALPHGETSMVKTASQQQQMTSELAAPRPQ